jgi:hypothetical protein
VTATATEPPPYPILGTGSYSLFSSGTGLTKDLGYPSPTGTAPSAPRNATVPPPCTVNVPQANLDWWYAATYDLQVGHLRRINGSYTDGLQRLSGIPNSESFNVASALSRPAYTTAELYDPDWDLTWTFKERYTVTPSATITSVLSRTQYQPMPSDNIILEKDRVSFMVNLPNAGPASLTIGQPNRTEYVVYSATPFLYFSAYEVESAVPVTANGSVGIATTTQTITLAGPYAYPYWLKGIEDSVSATGPLPTAFLQQIPQSSCALGSFQATVTVVVIVNLSYFYYLPGDPFIVHIESTVLGFEDPDPTTDPYVVVQATKNPTYHPLEWTPDPDPTPAPVLSSKVVAKPSVVQAPSPDSTSHNGDGSPARIPSVLSPTGQTIGTIGTAPLVILPSSVVVLGSQTLIPGAAPITFDGNPVSLVPQGTAVVVGTRTSALPEVGVPVNQPRPPPILTLGSLTLTPNAATQFFIAPGQTLTPGGTAIVSGTLVSLAPSASLVVFGSSTQFLPAPIPAPTPKPSIVFGGSTFTAVPGSTFVIAGQTLAPGSEIEVGGTKVSLAPSASFVVIDGATSALANPTPAPRITVGDSIFVANPGSTFFLGGQTLVPGQAITFYGTMVSLEPSASFVVVNGATSAITNSAARGLPAEITFGGQVITASPAGDTFVVNGHTLAPGSAIEVDGTTLSLGPSASFVVINGVTSVMANFPGQSLVAEVTFGGEVITASPGNTFVIKGHTLMPGQAINVDGTTLSLDASASFIVINGATSTLADVAAHTTLPVLTIGTNAYTALSIGTTYLIDGHYLKPGGTLSLSGTLISLAAGATALIINGQTTYLTPQSPMTNPPLLTIGSETFSAQPGTGTVFVIDSQTLTPGGVITVHGTTISLASGATQLVYGSSGHSTTTALFPATTTRSQSATMTSMASAGATGLDDMPLATAASTSTAEKDAASGLLMAQVFGNCRLALFISMLSLMFG